MICEEQIHIKREGLYQKMPLSWLAGIEFREGLVSLALLDKEANTLVSLDECTLSGHGSAYPQSIPEMAADLLLRHPWLVSPGMEVRVFIDIPQNVIVPAAFHDPFQKESLYKLHNETLSRGDWIYTDNIQAMEAVNIYPLPLSAENRIRSLLPGAKIKHWQSAFLDSILLQNQGSSKEKQVIVDIEQGWLFVIVLSGGKIHYLNSFSFVTEQDLLYYLLYALKMNECLLPGQEIELCGRLSGEFKIIAQLKEFLPACRLMPAGPGLKADSVFDRFRLVTRFTLINGLQ